ncbi:uncharacterized protein CELE_B0507.5 [Caenorhabditis elegans]|uniref:Uncharacterized protein n=1 Tax=Caenorhabditis elegans TaxID=6239 RepID=E3W722_CAEEL|nr:Uncharacterized protein CELE_B0507.5 [Caenorhabditis elegans]CCD62080.1 Uncharacterized protein CELE_B0507.5 [Caenorhabditis elegans]|eukprot:NP_001256109.1 Uncharacterized protein CELE_B0507.5 [Caenorhabditis elegans]
MFPSELLPVFVIFFLPELEKTSIFATLFLQLLESLYYQFNEFVQTDSNILYIFKKNPTDRFDTNFIFYWFWIQFETLLNARYYDLSQKINEIFNPSFPKNYEEKSNQLKDEIFPIFLDFFNFLEMENHATITKDKSSNDKYQIINIPLKCPISFIKNDYKYNKIYILLWQTKLMINPLKKALTR